MRNILIKSNVYSYIIIRDFYLKPLAEGVLEDDGTLTLQEYRGFKSLVDSKKITVSEDDYNYLVNKSSDELDLSVYATKTDVESTISVLTDGAPESLDTLKEIADWIEENQETVDSLVEGLDSKVNVSDLDNYTTLEQTQLAVSSYVDYAISGISPRFDLKVDKVTGKGLSTNDFTAAYKTKLDSIAVSANNYVHPTSGVVAGTYNKVTVNTQGHVISAINETTLAGLGITNAYTKTEVDTALNNKANNTVVTTTANGLMTKEDKTKLDSLSKIEIIELTQQAYDALPEADKTKTNTLYIILDS